jgi:osmotically-inducible protein OsmY
MKTLNNGICTVIFGTSLLLAPSLIAAPQNAQSTPSEPTAGQAKNDKADLQLARHIRRDVVKDKTLSTDGHNVKIIAKDGNVTLRGEVHSDDEKKTIDSYAHKYVVKGNVDDQLTVTSK